MAAVSCALYFFENDGISPFIPLCITRVMCAPLIWSFRRLVASTTVGIGLGTEPDVGNGNAAPHLLHDLVNVPVQNGHGPETLNKGGCPLGIIGSPDPSRIDSPQWNMRDQR